MNTEQPKQIEDAIRDGVEKAWRSSEFYERPTDNFPDHIIFADGYGAGFHTGLAAARSDGWIAVEDRLPDVEGNYLCSCVFHKSGERDPAVFELYWSGVEWEDDDDRYDINDTWEIIAWMPLPEPWRKIEPPQPSSGEKV